MARDPKIILSAEDRTAAAFASAGRHINKLGFNLDSLKTAAIGALGALAVPVSAAALVGLAQQASRAILEIKDLSEATGASIGNISALDRIARETGGSFEDAGSILVKFNAALKDAERTKEIGAILKSMNLDIKELKQLDPAEALRQTALALSKFEDDGNKARATQELFGRSVQKAAPFLRELAEAGELNGKVTKEQTEKVDKFNKTLARLQANAQDAARSIVLSLVPAINQVFDDISTFSDKASLAGLASNVIKLKKDIDILESKKGNPFFNSEAIDAQIDALQVKFAAAKAAFNAADTGRPRLVGSGSVASGDTLLRRATRPSLQGTPDEPPKPKTGTPKDPFAEAKRYSESLQRQLEATEKLTVVDATLRDIQLGRLGKVTEAQKASILDTAAQIDAAREFEEIQKQFAQLDKESIDRKKALAAAGAAVFEATRTPLEKLNTDMAELDRLLGAGVISWDTYARASLDAADQAEGFISKVTDGAKEAGEQAKRLGDAFSSTFDSAFREGQSFGDLLKKLAYDAINIQFLTPAAQKAGSALGSIFSGIFGGARAAGGAVTAGTTYLVGEKGPELWTAPANGNIIPNNALGGMGGSSFTFAPVIDARGSDAGVQARIDASMRQAEARFRATIVPTVMAAANRGGSAARALGRA